MCPECGERLEKEEAFPMQEKREEQVKAEKVVEDRIEKPEKGGRKGKSLPQSNG